jgi:hypothetical protein
MRARIKVDELPAFDAAPYLDNDEAIAAYLTDCFAAVAVGGGQPSNLRSRPYCGQSGQQTAPAQATGVRCTADVPGVGTGPEAQGPGE